MRFWLKRVIKKDVWVILDIRHECNGKLRFKDDFRELLLNKLSYCLIMLEFSFFSI